MVKLVYRIKLIKTNSTPYLSTRVLTLWCAFDFFFLILGFYLRVFGTGMVWEGGRGFIAQQNVWCENHRRNLILCCPRASFLLPLWARKGESWPDQRPMGTHPRNNLKHWDIHPKPPWPPAGQGLGWWSQWFLLELVLDCILMSCPSCNELLDA